MLNLNVIKLLMIVMFISSSWADTEIYQKSASDEVEKIRASLDQCEKIKLLLVGGKFPTECDEKYLLFGSNSNLISNKKNFVDANYNLLHPGTSKALFKDFSLMANVINSFDLVSVQEVLPVIGHDADVNSQVESFLFAPENYGSDKSTLKSLYRSPGYFKLLLELKKLDPSWSLILTPRGDAALIGSVEEYAGYFFRSSLVKLNENKYCQDTYKLKGNKKYLGCIVDFGSNNKFISRRPFIASFSISKINITAITSHVIFNFSGSEADKTNFLKSIFNVSKVEEIGKSVNDINFARFGEMKLIIDFMKKYSLKYNDSNLFYAGDTNLNYDLEYWNDLISNSNLELLIKEPTTLSPQKFNRSQEETFGLANSYDHFLLNKKKFNFCDEGRVYSYINSPISEKIKKDYLIRDLNITNSLLDDLPPGNEDNLPPKLDYPLTKAAENKMNNFAKNFEIYLASLKTVKNGQIVEDSFQIPERVESLKNRVFLRQLTNSFYYRFYLEILSDHFPAYISCTL